MTGPTLDLDLPIFNQGQGAIARLTAQYRQARDQLEAGAVNVRSEVREARDQLVAARDLTSYIGKRLLPTQQQALNLTLQQYNYMLKGAYDFLQEWAIPPGTFTPNPNVMVDFDVFTFNSRVWPGTDPLVVRLNDRVRVSFANLSMDSHPIHFHGHRWWVVGTDGARSRGAPGGRGRP